MTHTSRLGTAVAVFAFLVAALALPGVASAKEGGNGHKEVGSNYNHGKPKAFAKKLLPKLEKGQAPQGPAKVGDVRIWPALDDVNGTYLKEYTLRGVGEHIEVWVANDLLFPEGDCRNDPFLSSDGNTYSRVTITDEQVDYFINEFETNIYPKESAVFSVPPQRNGHKAQLPTFIPNLPSSEYKGEGDNIVVLIDNVRDTNYYDMDNAHSLSYIGGFFWSYFNDLTNRNVMTVDAWDWVHRTTGDPPNDPSTDPCLNSVAKPYDYEGTFAHEYQHLLEEYEDPDEVSWINEGISDWAQTLTGYVNTEPTIDEPDYDSHIQCFLGWLEHASPYNPIPKPNAGPENSLTWWEDQGDDEILCDYGAAYTFMEMLAGRYGTEFMTALHREDAGGFEGLQNVLDQFATGKTAFDVLHEWAAMVALDHFLDLPGGTFTGGSIGDYTTPTLDAQIDWANDDAYSTPGAPPNGSDYVRLRDGSEDWFSAAELTSINFNGASAHAPDPIEWTVDNGSLYSGSTDLMDRAIVRQVTVPATNATLSFRTKHDLEQNWDFGFVQVSTDNGETFQSLTTCAGTTDVHDPGAHPTVQANVPGYTGLSDWVTRTCDLSNYAGQTIYLAFRAVTDWNTLGNDATHANDGWWVDDVTLGGTVISNGDSLAGWQSMTEVNPIETQFTVQIVSYTSDGSVAQIAQLPLDANQDGSLSGTALQDAIADGADVVGVIVTYDEPTETVLRYAPYVLTANGITQPGG